MGFIYLVVLNRTQIQYNILGKNKRSKLFGAFTLISEFEYSKGMITYSFPQKIEKMILNPKMFGKINLVVIKSLRSRYSIALYELAEDYINVQIPKMSIEKFRELMGIEENQYYKFAMFRKYVIDVAIKEINDRENISFTISYELEKMGQKITHIKFHVRKKLDVLQLKDRQKKFYAWKKHIIVEYKEQTICNNLTELKYLKWVLFYINKDGFIGKIVDENRTILDKEESLKIWEYLYKNPSKMTIIPLTQLDILDKDFKGKKIRQITSTILGGQVKVILEIIGFKIDRSRDEESYFMEVRQEDDSKFWSKRSFSFYEIIEMEFI